MSDAERIADILADWYDRREQGEAIDPSDVVQAHPDVAAALEAHFEAQAIFDRIAGRRAPSSHVVPTTLGEFVIVREVGRGGMGVVYEAEQTTMRRRVALKVLFPSITSNRRSVERFQREARAAGRLHHTNIVSVYSMGEERGVWFYAMELVEGRPLDQVIDDVQRFAGSSRIPRAPDVATTGFGTSAGTRAHYERVARAFAGVAEGLDAAHGAGIVHRDVKPSNLVLDSEGTLRLMDFGLARMADEAAATRTGDLMGTPAYMSPEQVFGVAASIDRRTDVYSLGATLYEAITLHAPFEGATLPQVFAHIRARDPRTPRRLDPRIPRDLETIVRKAMEKDPARRYATAGDLARDLQLFAVGAAIGARRIGPVERAWRTVRRHKALSSAVATACILAVAAVALGVRAAREAEARRTFDYERLCVRVEAEFARATTHAADLRMSGRPSGRVGDDLAEAIALAPERREAYLIRGLANRGAPLEDRLADIDAARARGLAERTYRFARAYVLVGADRGDQAAREEAFGAAAPSSTDPLDSYFEGRLLVIGGDLLEGIERLTAALREAPEGSLARPMARFARAVAREAEGNLAGAIEDLSSFRGDANDAGPAIRFRMAELWARLGHPERATDLLGEALEDTRRVGTREAWSVLGSVVGRHARSFPEFSDRATAEALRAFPDDMRLLGNRHEALARLRRHAEALPLAQRVAELAPESAEAQADVGHVLAGLGRFEEAAAACLEALAIDERCLMAHTGLTQVLVRLGRLDEAERHARRAVALDPSGHEAHEALASVLCGWTSSWAEGLREAERAIALDPTCPMSRELRAEALTGLGRLDDAMAERDRVLQIDPNDAVTRRFRGAALHRAGRLSEALADFDAALEIDPSYSRVHLDRGDTLRLLGRPSDALSEYQLARATAAESVDALVREANVLDVDLARPGDSLQAAERAIALDPKRADAWHAKGNALARLARAPEAVEAYRESVRLVPERARSHADLGAYLSNLGRWNEAMVELDEAIRINGNDANTHRSRAITLQRLGRPEDALASYRLGNAVAPADVGLLIGMAALLAHMDRGAEAATFWQRIADLDSKDPQARNALAWYLATTPDRSRREPARAARLAREAVSLEPKDGAIWNTLGVALCAAGEWKDACEALENSMELRGGGDASDWFFAAIAHHHLGHAEEGRKWFDRAVAWRKERAVGDEELARFERDAEEALGAALEGPGAPK